METLEFKLDSYVSGTLRKISKDLDLTESEVIFKGILVMSLYAELKKSKKGVIILRDFEGMTDSELIFD